MSRVNPFKRMSTVELDSLDNDSYWKVVNAYIKWMEKHNPQSPLYIPVRLTPADRALREEKSLLLRHSCQSPRYVNERSDIINIFDISDISL